jgi:hypothetical protein
MYINKPQDVVPASMVSHYSQRRQKRAESPEKEAQNRVFHASCFDTKSVSCTTLSTG